MAVVDRRSKNTKSVGIRKKFVDRVRSGIKNSVKKAIEQKTVRDITDSSDGNVVTIPTKDIAEPQFHHRDIGQREFVLPGNVDKIVGDTIQKSSEGEGRGGYSGESGDDDFIFSLSKDEFLKFFFEDLELPDMIKTQLEQTPEYKIHRAGYSNSGSPNNLNILRSLRNAIGRVMSLEGATDDDIAELEEQLENTKDSAIKTLLINQIQKLKDERGHIPFIDDVDIRYNKFERRPEPATQAAMFCLMDVSGSMGDHEKDLAKRFFMLLYVFLQTQYKHVDVVFIRHHSEAKECSEQDFFYGTETGGTTVSTSLELANKIIRERYNRANWNVYIAQATDGDNDPSDNSNCKHIITEKLLPLIQYFAYVQIGNTYNYKGWMNNPRENSSLWKTYESIAAEFNKLVVTHVEDKKEIFSVFRNLFKKKQK